MSVRWELHCDRPGCSSARVETGASDASTARALCDAARAAGWQIQPYVDVPLHFCAEHRVPEIDHVRITSLVHGVNFRRYP